MSQVFIKSNGTSYCASITAVLFGQSTYKLTVSAMYDDQFSTVEAFARKDAPEVCVLASCWPSLLPAQVFSHGL